MTTAALINGTSASMPTDEVHDWGTANQRRLLAGLEVIRRMLLQLAHDEPGGAELVQAASDAEAAAVAAMQRQAAIEAIATAFQLTEFEQRMLLLCAAVELDPSIGAACAALQAGQTSPTFGLGLRLFRSAHWSALAPAAALQYWRLITRAPGESITTQPLRIDERILHHVAGVAYFDERLAPYIHRAPLSRFQLRAHDRVVASLSDCWSEPGGRSQIAQLCGRDRFAAFEIAARAAAEAGASLFTTSCRDLPGSAEERHELVRLWQREVALSGPVLLIDCLVDDAIAVQNGVDFAALCGGPAAVMTREPIPRLHAIADQVEVPTAAAAQHELIRSILRPAVYTRLRPELDRATASFRLSLADVAAAAHNVGAGLKHEDGPHTRELIWDAFRNATRPAFEGLAQRIVPRSDWADLVLPPAQLDLLRQIADAVTHSFTVHHSWGLARGDERGIGISVLFAGASGTGKTLAAEVIAGELRLDLYRVDLSQVVSKYIGETEKNLSRIFDAAEPGGAVLLFDEADALFGKRSEVRDSHDRYANIEVSYLLQRMESYRGLAILTTNMKGALDSAFMRRLRFVVHFPFPDAGQRAELWKRAFPAAVPSEGLDPAKLSQLKLAGGNIRNIALNACLLAAAAGSAVRMGHVRRAAHAEYAKLDKTLNEAEVAGWK